MQLLVTRFLLNSPKNGTWRHFEFNVARQNVQVRSVYVYILFTFYQCCFVLKVITYHHSAMQMAESEKNAAPSGKSKGKNSLLGKFPTKCLTFVLRSSLNNQRFQMNLLDISVP